MVVDSLLPLAECGPNDHRKDAPPFIRKSNRREDKEAIADSIILNIDGQLENQISMTLSPNVLAPDEPINITIEGTPEQRVCINIADESVDINQLSKMTSNKIFEMLGDLEDGEQGQEWWQLSTGSLTI